MFPKLSLIIMLIILVTFIFSCEKEDSYSDSCDSTIVFGRIEKDTIWKCEYSPYIVTDTVVVDSGVILIIEPGVVVKFEDYSALIIKGKLIAEGNIENNITFTSFDNDFGQYHEDSWIGIMFDSCQSGSIMRYCKIENCVGWDGKSPIVIKDCSPTISSCIFAPYLPLWDTGGSYILCIGDSRPVLENNKIPKLISAFRGSGISCINGANPLISNNGIEYDGTYECWAVSGGGFLDGNYIFCVMDGDTIIDTSLGNPVDTIGDGILNTNSTSDPPGYINVDGVKSPKTFPNTNNFK